jgi:hypothetical protein
MKFKYFITFSILFFSFNCFAQADQEITDPSNPGGGPDIPIDFGDEDPDGPCVKSRVSQAFIKNEISSTFDDSVLYGIRDNILMKSEKGKKYVADYNYIGKYIDASKLSMNSLFKIVKNIPNIYSSYKKMNEADNNTIIISDDFRTDIIDIINSFKEISNNSEYIKILNNLILDVQTVSNKDKKFVLEFLSLVITNNEENRTNVTLNSDLDFKIYPNPTSSIIQIESTKKEEYVITICNQSGFELTKNFNTNLIMDFSNEKNGIYIYTISIKKEIIKKGIFIKN